MRAPERLQHAVDLLDLDPGTSVLEIGSGPGVAADMVSRRLESLGGPSSRVRGIDRSATATARAESLHREAIEQRRLAFVQVALADVDPAILGRFDVVFAVNVNVFWTQPAQRELLRIRELLVPGGRVWLFFAPPSGADTERLTGGVRGALTRAGFGYDQGLVEMTAGSLVWFRAVPGARDGETGAR